MNWYSMALENGLEHIETWEGGSVERKAGLCIIAFFDVDWANLADKCDEILAQKHHKLCKLVAILYQRLRHEMSALHPILEAFARNQLMGDIKNACMENFPADTNLPEWHYIASLEKDEPCVEIQDKLPRLFLRQCAKRFRTFAAMQQKLISIADGVYHDAENGESLCVLKRYYFMRQESWEYLTLSQQMYNELKTEFRLTLDGKLCDIAIPRAVTPADQMRLEEKKIAAHTYQTTDHLEALVLWELDYMAANSLSLRRCAYCGRYFLPYSVANCYCDRPVEGASGKTCKEVGAATKHQEEVNGDAARTLYRKVNNRTQQAAKRYEPQYPNIRKVNYKNWQYEAKQLLEQVQAGELDYETFAAAIDKTPRELLGI